MGHCSSEENTRGLLSANSLYHVALSALLFGFQTVHVLPVSRVGGGMKPLIETREKIGGEGEQKWGDGNGWM